VAEQLALQDHQMLRAVGAQEWTFFYLDLNPSLWAPGLVAVYDRQERLRRWVAGAVVTTWELPRRVAVAEFFVRLAGRLFHLRDWASGWAVASALLHDAVGRLSRTWAALPPRSLSAFRDLLASFPAAMAPRALAGTAAVPDPEVVLGDWADLLGDPAPSLRRQRPRSASRLGGGPGKQERPERAGEWEGAPHFFQSAPSGAEGGAGRERGEWRGDFNRLRSSLRLLRQCGQAECRILPDPELQDLLAAELKAPPSWALLQEFSACAEGLTASGEPEEVPLVFPEAEGEEGGGQLRCSLAKGQLQVLSGTAERLVDLLVDVELQSATEQFAEEFFLVHQYFLSPAQLLSMLLVRFSPPATVALLSARDSPCERAELARRQAAVRSRVMDLVRRWTAQSFRELRRDRDFLAVLFDFTGSAEMQSADETMFLLTLENGFRDRVRPSLSLSFCLLTLLYLSALAQQQQ
jgi:hypothetical protein